MATVSGDRLWAEWELLCQEPEPEAVVAWMHERGLAADERALLAARLPELEHRLKVLLLPRDPDGDCARLRREFLKRTGATVSVIISDSVGRAWRNGTVGIAIGVAGLPALLDIRGHDDLFGRPLQSSQIGLADELAAAASLVQGQADEGVPAVLIRGFVVQGEATPAKALIREGGEDLFR